MRDGHVTGHMRVLMIQPTGVSGVWHYATRLSRALAEVGLQVGLATLLPYEDFGDDEKVSVWSLGIRRKHSSALSSLPRRLLDHVGKLGRLRETMQAFHPEIVHLHAPLGKLDSLYFRYMRSLGARVFYTAHDARPLVGESKWSDWARYEAADGIVVHSSRCRQYLLDGGIDERKIRQVVHANYLDLCDGRDLSKEKARALLGVPVDSRVVLFFGAIAPYKGLDVLIDAFGRLQRDDPHLYLVIAGGPLEDFGPYRRRIEALGSSERIVQDLRYVPAAELSKFFLAADMVALPYRRVSQSGVLQLAYGFGRPVVATDVGGLGEAVAEDGTGMVIDGPDADELARAIRQLLANPGTAARMGIRGRTLAETKYSWRAVALQVIDAYNGARSTETPPVRALPVS